MTEQEKKDFDMNLLDSFYEDEKRQTESDKSIWAYLERNMSSDWLEAVKEELEESGCCDMFGITDYYEGDLQDDRIFETYVNQTTNGGYLGDDFAGCTYIQMDDNQYFKFHYSM